MGKTTLAAVNAGLLVEEGHPYVVITVPNEILKRQFQVKHKGLISTEFENFGKGPSIFVETY